MTFCFFLLNGFRIFWLFGIFLTLKLKDSSDYLQNIGHRALIKEPVRNSFTSLVLLVEDKFLYSHTIVSKNILELVFLSEIHLGALWILWLFIFQSPLVAHFFEWWLDRGCDREIAHISLFHWAFRSLNIEEIFCNS